MRNLLPAILLLGFLSSCTTAEFIQHTPTLVNSGMHTEEDEFSGRLLYSTGSSTSNSVESSTNSYPYQRIRGVQGQASYSVGEYLALQGLFMHSAEKGGSQQNGNRSIVYNYKRNIAEAGIAFFHPFIEDGNIFRRGRTFYYELAAGTGFGTYQATEVPAVTAPGGRFYDHNVLKFYFQPSVYWTSDLVRFQFGLKLAAVNFSAIKTDYTIPERESRKLPVLSRLNTSTLDWFVRGEFTVPGAEWIGLSGQLQLSSDLEKKYFTNMNDNNYGIGLCFRFGQAGGTRKKNKPAAAPAD